MNKTKYKLIDGAGYTRRGKTGETYWLDGLEKIAKGEGNTLCSDNVIHYYDHPLLAVLFNPIHAAINNARLIEIEIDRELTHDGLKGGCKKAKYLREIKLPKITLEQKVTFAIKISLKCYKDADYRKWAKNWLNGDRTRAAAKAAEAAEFAASAEAAARAAAKAAEAAEWAAAKAEAAASAEAAEWAAAKAAAAEWAAAKAAEAAAKFAASAAALKINKLFIKIIEEICNE